MKNALVAVVLSWVAFLQTASADGAYFRYTLDESAAEPVWTDADTFQACREGLIDSNKYPISGAGAMVIEVLQDATVAADEILNFAGSYFGFHTDGGFENVTLTFRSGGSTRQTLTYTGTQELQTWFSSNLIFSNLVFTASNLAANQTFFYSRNFTSVKLMNGAEIANCPCRGVMVESTQPFTMYPGSSIHGNASSGNGGGVMLSGGGGSGSGGGLVLAGGTIYGNTANLGGGVYVSAAAPFVISNASSSVSGNTSTGDATGANVYAAASALPFFSVDAVATGQVFDYYSPVTIEDGVVFGTYTCEDAGILSHVVNRCTMSAGASVVAEEGQILVKSTVAATKFHYTLDESAADPVWKMTDSFKTCMDYLIASDKSPRSGAGHMVIELMEDATVDASEILNHGGAYFGFNGNDSIDLTIRSGGSTLQTLTYTGTQELQTWFSSNLIFSNLVFTASNLAANQTFFYVRSNTSVKMMNGAEIANCPCRGVMVESGRPFTLYPGSSIHGNVSTGNGGGVMINGGAGGLVLAGGTIYGNTAVLGGGVYVSVAVPFVVSNASSSVCGNTSTGDATGANVYAVASALPFFRMDAVASGLAFDYYSPVTIEDGVVFGAYTCEDADILSHVVNRCTMPAGCSVVAEEGQILVRSTVQATKFHYTLDESAAEPVWKMTDSFKTCIDYLIASDKSPRSGAGHMVIELMEDATVDGSDILNHNGQYFGFNGDGSIDLTIRSGGSTRQTLTYTGTRELWTWFSPILVFTNIVLTARDLPSNGTFLWPMSQTTVKMMAGAEIANCPCRAVSIGCAYPFSMYPGSLIRGNASSGEGGGVYVGDGSYVLDLRGGAITGNVANSGVYVKGASAQVRVSGEARIADNVTSAGADANLRFNGENGLFLLTGDLTDAADVRLSRNDAQGGVFGVSTNLTSGCGQAWQGAKRIHSDGKKSLFGRTVASGSAVNLIWSSPGFVFFLR